jgi:hypothetical protein
VNKNNKQKQKRNWATCSFFGPETGAITKLLKNTEIGISYRTKNNIKHLLRIKENHNNDKYNLSCVYQLRCGNCPQKYIGQTGRTFRIRFKEHIRDIRNNGQSCKFAQHILDTTHAYGTIENTMKIVHIQKKVPVLDTYEKYRIYEISKQGIQLNDNFAETYNPIYNVIMATYQSKNNDKQPNLSGLPYPHTPHDKTPSYLKTR